MESVEVKPIRKMNISKEYLVDETPGFDLKSMQTGQMSLEAYKAAHEGTVLFCHDVYVQYQNGILLVVRDNLPGKGFLWPLGGRVIRGFPVADSLKKRVKGESDLDLENITELGHARVLCTAEPFGHGKGTDSYAVVCFAEGRGEVKLDKLHKHPTIVRPQEYTAQFRQQLHPYVQDFMDIAINLVK